MTDTTSTTIPKAVAWDPQCRSVSDGSRNSITTSEQLALIGFAQRLYSVATNDDSKTAEEVSVRKEAELLMSLSCMPPSNITIESGRASPSSDASLGQSAGSRGRETFTFSCPSLSLDSRHLDPESNQSLHSSSSCSTSSTDRTPAVLLGRVLKVSDMDALRLSSEAMARNIMQSYEKAMSWRITSWINTLSRVLVDKEKELVANGLDTPENQMLLRESSEGLLIVYLHNISSKIRVDHAMTDFKILSQKPLHEVNNGPPTKRQRRDSSTASGTGLAETDYEYSVTHLMNLECVLSIEAPGVGNVSIELKVPGTMKGVFLSLEDEYEHLTDVVMDVDTDILASMIEKSSRMVVRASVESFLGNNDVDREGDSAEEINESTVQEAPVRTPDSTGSPTSCTPIPSVCEDRLSNFALVTPKDSSISDVETYGSGPILLLPDSSDDEKPILKPKRSRGLMMSSPSPTNLEELKSSPNRLPNVVTPSKANHEFNEGKAEGPNFPALVEIALQYHTK